MNKVDLKTGMRAEVRSGNRYVVILNSDRHEDSIVRGESRGLISDYNEDLTANHGSGFDILRIFESPSSLTNMLNIERTGDLLWERTPEKTYEIDGVEYSESTLKSLIKKATE